MRLSKGFVIAVGAIVATAGAALAVWTVTGSGQAEGGATVAQSLVIIPVAPSNFTLYPGGPAGVVEYEISNPNPFAITVTTITYGTPISTNTTSCPSSNVSVDASAPTSFSTPIPANAVNDAFGIPGVLDLSHSAPNGCQGVAFLVPIQITATQQ